ncbi:MAG TPA: (2Fe-2S)-binding protein, partial [Burkholderiales bacterium]|nr:(2Fe-2S)-binding protein [Burkholderiales bacterium]
LERPFPIPGWTLPGVMTAGAAQILLKSAGLIARGPTVLAGTGPLLWLLAAQYLRVGGSISTILDTTSGDHSLPIGDKLAFLGSPYFGKGLRLLAQVQRRVRTIRGISELRAIGDQRLEAVAFRRKGGKEETLPAATLLLHQGIVPNVNLAMSAGIEHMWDDVQLCWQPVLDDFGNTSVPNISIAGDGAGIAGAESARARGMLAGLSALRSLRGEVRPTLAKDARSILARFTRGRQFLDRYYRPSQQFRIPAGDTIVCRCEEVTAAQVIAAAQLGCPGPNQLKAFLRCGMGPCQGRLCGLTVTEMIATVRRVSPQEIGYYRLRPPVKPITVGELAGLPKSDAAIRAVVRG